METKLKGEVTLSYVFGGISKKTGKPYLQVSDGIEAKFVNLSEDCRVTEDTFSEYERGEAITLVMERDAIADRGPVVTEIK